VTTKRKESKLKESLSTGPSDVLRIAERAVAALLGHIKEARRAELENEPSRLLRVLELARADVERLSGFREALDSLRPGVTDALERQFLELDSTFRSTCEQRGWRVDGQWPTLYVERALAVEFNERDRTVVVAGKRLDTCSSSAVISALEPLILTLIPKNFATRAFLQQLAAAYEDSRETRAQVPVFDVYRSLIILGQRPQFWRDARPSAFTGLTTDQFRAQLTRTMEDGVIETTDGRVLRLLAPLDPKDALFVYQPAEQRFGYVGRIEFVRPPEVGA
jgi:hypothetical protein